MPVASDKSVDAKIQHIKAPTEALVIGKGAQLVVEDGATMFVGAITGDVKLTGSLDVSEHLHLHESADPGTPNAGGVIFADTSDHKLKYTFHDGTTTDLAPPASGGGGGSGLLLSASVALSASEINHLNSVPKQLVAAPGPGKILVPIQWLVHSTFGTVPIYGSDILLRYADSADHVFNVSNSGTQSPFTRQYSGFSMFNIPGVQQYNTFPDSTCVDAAIVISSDNPDTITTGAIATSTLAAGGASYAIADTGYINSGIFGAYVVDTVDIGGAVLTYHIDNVGAGCTVSNGVGTGVTTGTGDGNFTINITAITPGDPTGSVTLFYVVVTL